METEKGKQFSDEEYKRKLKSIAKNKILDELRRRKKLERIDANPEVFKKNIFDLEFEKREQDKLIIDEIWAQLTEKQHEAVKLHLYDGYTIEEIARDLKISSNGVKRRLKLALKKLRESRKEKKI